VMARLRMGPEWRASAAERWFQASGIGISKPQLGFRREADTPPLCLLEQADDSSIDDGYEVSEQPLRSTDLRRVC
jgi:hypothetical protein